MATLLMCIKETCAVMTVCTLLYRYKTLFSRPEFILKGVAEEWYNQWTHNGDGFTNTFEIH